MRVFLSILLLVLLAVASVAAVFALAKIERQPPVIGRPVVTRAFSPNGDGKIDTAKLTINVPRADRVDVKIVDGDARTITTLASDQRVRGRESWTWDGTATDGERASEGAYRMQVRLRERERTVLVPTTISLDVTPPQIHEFEADDSRLSMGVVRVNASVSGARNHHIEFDDSPLMTIRFRRSVDERSNPGARDDFLISARMPNRFAVLKGVDETEFLDFTFVSMDDAGNLATRDFQHPLPADYGNPGSVDAGKSK